MSERENKLRTLLHRVRANRSEERSSSAREAVERFKAEAHGRPATQVASPVRPPAAPVPPLGPPISVPETARAAAERAPVPPPSSRPFDRTSSAPPPGLQSPTRYSSQPPAVERPLSSSPAPAVVPRSAPAPAVVPRSAPAPAVVPRSAPPSQAAGRVPIRAQSVLPGQQSVVEATEPPAAPSAKTFGELLELTLSLRPQ